MKKHLPLTLAMLLMASNAFAVEVPKYRVYLLSEPEIPATLQTYITVERQGAMYIADVPADRYKSISGYIVFYLGEDETGRFNRDYVVGWRRMDVEKSPGIPEEPEPTPDPEPPACVPEWCDLPVQDCSIEEPMTGGTDSCANSCTKPSKEWPNCRHPDGTVGPKQGL
jgi:hypothetical protein